MAETIVPLGVRGVDEVLNEMERTFSDQGVPTLRRMQTALLTEELFAALRDLNEDGGMLRCTFPAPRTMELQYRSAKGFLNPDLSMVERLARNPCVEGVRAAFREGRCTITAEG